MFIREFHRRNLPHLYYNGGTYFVTYRLKETIQTEKLQKFNLYKIKNRDRYQFQTSFIKYDSVLHIFDNKIQHLKIPEVMEVCKSSIHYFDKRDFNLICYCIMPNHIHLVFDLYESTVRNVGEIMNSIKKYSAKKSNEILNRKGPFWQAESFDRLVRDDIELYFIIKYILLNPVNAGFVKDWKDWSGSYCNPMNVVIE